MPTTADYTVTSPDLERVQGMLDAYPQVSYDVLSRAMAETVDTVSSNIKREMQRPTARGQRGAMGRPIYQGQLISAIGGRVETIGGALAPSLRGIVDAGDVDHAAAVEFGQPPGTIVPIEPLKRWAHLKLGDEDLAYPIRAVIRKHGTKGYYMFARGWLRSQRWVSLRFRRALKDIVNTLRRHGGTGRGMRRRTTVVKRGQAVR